MDPVADVDVHSPVDTIRQASSPPRLRRKHNCLLPRRLFEDAEDGFVPIAVHLTKVCILGANGRQNPLSVWLSVEPSLVEDKTCFPLECVTVFDGMTEEDTKIWSPLARRVLDLPALGIRTEDDVGKCVLLDSEPMFRGKVFEIVCVSVGNISMLL